MGQSVDQSVVRNHTKQLQTIKVDSNHEHHRAGEGVGLSGEPPYHIRIGARKKFLEKQERSPTSSGFHWFAWCRFLEGTRVAVPQFKQ